MNKPSPLAHMTYGRGWNQEQKDAWPEWFACRYPENAEWDLIRNFDYSYAQLSQ